MAKTKAYNNRLNSYFIPEESSNFKDKKIMGIEFELRVIYIWMLSI